MKQYSKPVVTRVEFQPLEASLTACRTWADHNYDAHCEPGQPAVLGCEPINGFTCRLLE